MSIVAIGAAEQLGGYRLAGVEVLDAGDAAGARRAWESLAAEVELVLLTPSARTAIGPGLDEGEILWVEVPV